jgi:hypothetical protein
MCDVGYGLHLGPANIIVLLGFHVASYDKSPEF